MGAEHAASLSPGTRIGVYDVDPSDTTFGIILENGVNGAALDDAVDAELDGLPALKRAQELKR